MTKKESTDSFYLVHEDYLKAKDYTCPACRKEEVLDDKGDAFSIHAIYYGTHWVCSNCNEDVITLDDNYLFIDDNQEILEQGPIKVSYDGDEVEDLMIIERRL